MRKSILIVNVNWVGDVIFSTPFIKSVRDNYPESRISCLIHPRCAEVLEGNPRCNELIIYDEEGVHKSLYGKLKLIAMLRKKRFDTAFILHRSFTKALITMLAGIRERIGYSVKNRSILLTKAVDEPALETHKVEYFLNIARNAGLKVLGNSYEFFITDIERRNIQELLGRNGVGEGDRLVVICPGGNWPPKRWPARNFAELSDMLGAQLSARIAIAGASKDAELAEDIKRMMKSEPIVTCGKTSLKTLGALLERADLVIANDTGPMHIAVAMKTKVIALFGPTSPRLTGPYGEGSYRVIYKNETCETPCYDITCSDYRCMEAISVEDVLKEAANMLEKG